MKKFQIRLALLLIVIALSLLLSSCDALAAERAVAEEEIRTAQAVKDNPWDGGVAALVEEYASKLASAPDEDAIRAAVSEFGAAVEAHVNAKNSLLAEVQAVDLSSFFSSCDPLHLMEAVLTARDEAVLTVKRASTLAEAEAALASYKAFVLKKMEEQLWGPCDGPGNSGIMDEKIALFELVDAYEARAQLLMRILTMAYENGEISAAEYQLRMYGKEADASSGAIHGYEYFLRRLSWWDKYIAIVISTVGLQVAIEEEFAPVLTTPVDTLVSLLTDGVIVLPTEYAWDDALQAYVDGADVTTDLLQAIYEHFNEAVALFGQEGALALLRACGVDVLTGKPLLACVLDEIDTRYTALQAARAAASEVTALIDAAEGEAALDAAWSALADWAKEYAVLTVDSEARTVTFGKSYKGRCDELLADGKVDPEYAWDAVYYTQTYVVTYFVPNLDTLLSAGDTQG